jgi:two-component system cell cycle sensor histidine kinase/response regulator CckA
MSEKGKKILLMDDEKSIRDIYQRIFTALGYQTYLACNGVEAITLLKESLKLGNKFDIVILDLNIAKGMGGKDTIKELKKIDANIKSIAVSGCSDDPVLIKYKQYGFDAVLTKPFKVKELQNIIKQLIDRKRE